MILFFKEPVNIVIIALIAFAVYFLLSKVASKFNFNRSLLVALLFCSVVLMGGIFIIAAAIWAGNFSSIQVQDILLLLVGVVLFIMVIHHHQKSKKTVKVENNNKHESFAPETSDIELMKNNNSTKDF